MSAKLSFILITIIQVCACFGIPALMIVSCGDKLQDHYSGFVINEAGEPISGVSIREDLPAGNNDTTDYAGYFKIRRNDNVLCNLIFSKKGYRTDTVKMVWLMHGEKEMHSDLITKDSAKWAMREIVCRDSTLNWSDKIRFFDNDSIEMRRDERLMYTQYLNCGKDEITYRYYDYHGAVEREVYNIGMKMGPVHFRDYHYYDVDSVENRAYLTVFDSVPELLRGDWGEYWRIGIIKETVGERLLSKKYILWRSSENCIAGQHEESIGTKTYYNDGNYEIEKYTDDGVMYWDYYPNGQLKGHWINKGLYGGNFSTYSVNYDSLGHKTEETNWEHLYPKWGTSYNDTFSVATTRKYYKNGKLKSLTKTKSFSESESYRCGTWIYYDEQGKVIKTEKYGNCYNFQLEEKYNEINFSEEEIIM